MADANTDSPILSAWRHEYEKLLGRDGDGVDMQVTREIVAHNLKWVRSHFSLSLKELADAANTPLSILKEVEKVSPEVDPQIFSHIAMHLEMYCRISRVELMTVWLNDDRYAFSSERFPKRTI